MTWYSQRSANERLENCHSKRQALCPSSRLILKSMSIAPTAVRYKTRKQRMYVRTFWFSQAHGEWQARRKIGWEIVRERLVLRCPSEAGNTRTGEQTHMILDLGIADGHGQALLVAQERRGGIHRDAVWRKGAEMRRLIVAL